jgi:hypothetical protein
MYNIAGSAVASKAAKIVSIIFHPLLVPLYGMLIIFFAPTFFWYVPIKVKLLLLLVTATNTILIPVSLLPFFRHRNIISSWMIETRKDRTVPLITITLCYIVTSYIMIRLQIPVFIKAFILAVTFIVICITIINFWWKISIHSAGAGAILGLVIMLWVTMGVSLTWLIVPLLLFTGITLSSRLLLNSHNQAEVYAGLALGFSGIGLFILIF